MVNHNWLPVLKSVLLGLTPYQLSPAMKAMVRSWPERPSAAQLLELIDHCGVKIAASPTVLAVLNEAYDEALAIEKKQHKDIVRLAVWRRKL